MKTSSFLINVSGSGKNDSRVIKCRATEREEVNVWTVEQVCDFVRSIDICAEYVEVSGSRFLVIFLFLLRSPFTFLCVFDALFTFKQLSQKEHFQ